MNDDIEYQLKEINRKLKGGTIISALSTPDSDAFGLLVQVGKKKINVWIDSDAEGNGAGWLSIEEAQ